MSKNHEILKKIDSGRRSDWLETRAKKRSHKKARENARLVAIRVLTILRERNMSQTELAEKMGVSRQQVTKIVKGQENFTFETIDKLEIALGVTLMTIASPEPALDYRVVTLQGSATLSTGKLSGTASGKKFEDLLQQISEKIYTTKIVPQAMNTCQIFIGYSSMPGTIKVFTPKSTKSKPDDISIPKGSIDNMLNPALIQMS